MQAVTGRCYVPEPASLDGYARFAIRKQVFPGIVARQGEQVAGLVYRNIDTADFLRLDDFESDIYFRELVTVILEDQSHTSAFTYIVSSDFHHLLDNSDWDPEYFQHTHLDTYLKRMS